MKKRNVLLILAAILLICVGIAVLFSNPTYVWGFAREVTLEEAALRRSVTDAAVLWLNANQFDGTHKPIIDLYNSHTPLAENYTVTYTDSWCAAFGSAVAIVCGFTDIIPTECGCQRQIDRFRALDAWQEDDAYVPLPGDYIFYSMNHPSAGECTSWSDHVGIVVGTCRNQILVIEGNYAGYVKYRIVSVNDDTIRGYGTPNYGSLC